MSTTAEERIRATIREEGQKIRDYVQELVANVVIAQEGHPADAAEQILTESER
jgi:hypothetical protein